MVYGCLMGTEVAAGAKAAAYQNLVQKLTEGAFYQVRQALIICCF